MSHTVYSFPGNPRGNVCQILADMAGIPTKFVWTNLQDAKAPEYTAKHPLGKIPLLETPEGSIFETNAILRYFARASTKRQNLLGKNLYEEGLVNQWLDFAVMELYPLFPALFYATFGWREADEQYRVQYTEAKKKLFGLLQIINNHLALNTYLAGHQVTVADVNLFSFLAYVFQFILDENQRKPFINLTRYYIHLGNLDEIRKFYRQPYLTKVEWIQGAKDKNEKKEDKSAQEKKPKQEAPKKDAPKKDTKPKVEEADEDEAPKKPAKNPLDSLPPTTFDLFSFKTLFVNAPNKADALKFLWENYDANGYSFWYVKYQKYEGEGIKLHLTSNLKDSTLQRLDTFRKYVFGTFGVYGDEGNYEIRGVWLWRGTEIPDMIKELPNYEYHDWIKLDHTNEEHRKLLNDYWSGMEQDVSVADGLVARDTGYVK